MNQQMMAFNNVQIDDNMNVSYSVGDNSETCYIDGFWNNWSTDCIHYYYPNYIVAEDKTTKAFRVAKNLIAKKLVKCTTIKQFIDLIDTITSEL